MSSTKKWTIGASIGVSILILFLVSAFVGWVNIGHWMLNSFLMTLAPDWQIAAGTALTVLLLCVGAVHLLTEYFRGRTAVLVTAWILVVACIIWCIVAIALRGVRTAEYAYGAYTGSSASSAEFVVEDEQNLPAPLTQLGNSKLIAITEAADTEPLPGQFDERIAPKDGAITQIKNTSASATNVEPIEETTQLIYMNGKPVWSAILDGKLQAYTYGVAYWDGTGEAEECTFDGSNNRLDRRFGTFFGGDLNADIKRSYPRFVYDMRDVYGYCDDGEPVIVVPGVKHVGYWSQRVDQSYGVLEVRGTPHGGPGFKMWDDKQITRNTFPGPIYPLRLAENQLEHLDDTTGWRIKTTNVAYQPVEGPAGSSNSEDSDEPLITNEPTGSDAVNATHLVRTEDGRLYWFTPMRPNKSTTSMASAYSLIPADELTPGAYNTQRIYAMSKGAAQIANMANMATKVKSEVETNHQAGYFDKEDRVLAEITPISITPEGTKWQLTATREGLPEYIVYTEGSVDFTVTVVSYDNPDAETPTSVTVDCNDPGATGEPLDALGCSLKALRAYDKLIAEEESAATE